MFYYIFISNGSYLQKEFESLVLGLVVLTDYNNHTYRISDIDYNVGPDSTFLLKNGDPITYREYYKSKYRITIREKRQPLLITRARPRDRRSGKCELIYLVPELCRATGVFSTSFCICIIHFMFLSYDKSFLCRFNR